MNDERWPRWVYGAGVEPDYRFTFANERTYLAWIRTALALLAAGVAFDVVETTIGDRWQHLLSGIFVALGLVCAVGSWIRWARAERALRHGLPLPSSSIMTVLVVGVAASSVLLLFGLWP